MREVKEVKPIYVTKYESADGKRFENKQACLDYEAAIEAKRAIVKAVEGTDCWIPFSGWDMEPDESRLYLIKSEEEFEALEQYHAAEYGDTYWDCPNKYPEVYMVLSREGFSIGYRLERDTIEELTDVANIISEYLYKAEQL